MDTTPEQGLLIRTQVGGQNSGGTVGSQTSEGSLGGYPAGGGSAGNPAGVGNAGNPGPGPTDGNLTSGATNSNPTSGIPGTSTGGGVVGSNSGGGESGVIPFNTSEDVSESRVQTMFEMTDPLLPFAIVFLLAASLVLLFRARNDIGSIELSKPNWANIGAFLIAAILLVTAVANYVTRLEARVSAIERKLD